MFPIEPLPLTSPLWTHPKVTITPHNAAQSSPRAIVSNILRRIDRFEAGMPLEHVVDRQPRLLSQPSIRRMHDMSIRRERLCATASATGSIATAMWLALA